MKDYAMNKRHREPAYKSTYDRERVWAVSALLAAAFVTGSILGATVALMVIA